MRQAVICRSDHKDWHARSTPALPVFRPEDFIGDVHGGPGKWQAAVERSLAEHFYDLFLAQTDIQCTVDVGL